jgi:hypothetical protein
MMNGLVIIFGSELVVAQPMTYQLRNYTKSEGKRNVIKHTFFLVQQRPTLSGCGLRSEAIHEELKSGEPALYPDIGSKQKTMCSE